MYPGGERIKNEAQRLNAFYLGADDAINDKTCDDRQVPDLAKSDYNEGYATVLLPKED